MFNTHHHSVFDKWWEFAAENYFVWEENEVISADLYYDPVVDEHVGRGPMGVIAPAWYIAPQRNEVALVGWKTALAMSGVMSDGPNVGLQTPEMATFILQLSGEFADPETKQLIWNAAEELIQPTWDVETGEFTLGLGLNEEYPRGQLNARMMAGWVCSQGAWSRIFNKPDLAKFSQPTVEGVDFPRVALSEAKWDGEALHLAAHAQNDKSAGTTTTLKLTNVASTNGWYLYEPDGTRTSLKDQGDYVEIQLLVNNKTVIIKQS
jgi:hypothetical protein